MAKKHKQQDEIGELTPQERRLIAFKRLNMPQGEVAKRIGMSRERFCKNLNKPTAPLHFERRLFGFYRSQWKKQQRRAA